MKILVYNIAASESGALTVLNDFYQQVKDNNDKSLTWVFVLSTPKLEETENIKVLRYPWVKKSWFHRLFFDYFVARKILKNYKIDKILSLQNIMVPNTKIHQVVYVHQAIPFVEHRFKLKENWKNWVYQNLIGSKIINSVKKADKVIVQTEWMKKACFKKSEVNINKIEVVRIAPEHTIDKRFLDRHENKKKFFYPAGTQDYKNHMTLLKACEILQREGYNDYNVTFTFSGTETKHASRLYKFAKSNHLNVNFVGALPREKVFDLYAESVLVFPSYIETVGLPLIEAKSVGSPILAADCAYAHEVLNQYHNAYYFEVQSYEQLAELMKKCMSNDLLLKTNKSLPNKKLDQIKIIDIL